METKVVNLKQKLLSSIDSLMEILVIKEQQMIKFDGWDDSAQIAFAFNRLSKYINPIDKECNENLKRISGGKTFIANGFEYSLSIRKGSIDYTRIPELSGVDLEQYRKSEVESWKLSKI